jgi:hypothetical protein
MRFGVLALAGLLALPAAAAAQNSGGFAAEPPTNLVPFTRFAVTPWVGLRVPYGTSDYFAITEGGDQFTLDEDRGGGLALGVNAQYQLTGPLNLVAGAAYSAGDEDKIRVTDPNDNTETFISDGSQVWFFKAGLQYRLPDPAPDSRRFHPAAYITVAPSVVVMDFPDFEGFDSDDVNGRSTNFGLNLGVDAATNLGSRGLTLDFGLEDYVTFWDEDRVRVRDESLLSGLFAEPVVVEYNGLAANILLLRAGVSWRF